MAGADVRLQDGGGLDPGGGFLVEPCVGLLVAVPVGVGHIAAALAVHFLIPAAIHPLAEGIEPDHAAGLNVKAQEVPGHEAVAGAGGDGGKPGVELPQSALGGEVEVPDQARGRRAEGRQGDDTKVHMRLIPF